MLFPYLAALSNFMGLFQVSRKFYHYLCVIFCNLYSWMYKSHLCLIQGPALTTTVALKILPFLLFSSISFNSFILSYCIVDCLQPLLTQV